MNKRIIAAIQNSSLPYFVRSIMNPFSEGLCELLTDRKALVSLPNNRESFIETTAAKIAKAARRAIAAP
jgi:hypothetical protein